ncbi:MAG: PadR family transcriptional regulator [Candidatus Bathyarchaeota archaeon]
MYSKQEEKTATKWIKESQKGYMRIAFLILLSKKPCHGYEMMKEVRERTEGFWKPTAGGVYPILQSLEKAGYIEGEWSPQKRKRKIYKITESGKLILDRALLKQNQIAESMNTLFKEYARDVLGLESKDMKIPKIPNPFSPFLHEESKNMIESLEIKNNQIQHMIKMLENEHQKIVKKLSKLKKRIDKNENIQSGKNGER